MASSARQISLLILLTLISSLHIHARESQFFNKVPGGNNNNVVEETGIPREPLNKQDETPNFIPQTESSYGLYGHESGQFPPTTTTTTAAAATATYKTDTNLPYRSRTEEPLNRAFLPSNYNPVAYVTKPEGYRNEAHESEAQGMNEFNFPKNYNTNSYVTEPQGINDANLPKNYNTEAYVTEPQDMNGAKLPKNYNNEAYVTEPQGMSDTRFMNRDAATTTTRSNSYYNSGNRRSPFQQQGMSDTRFLENGKYFYNVENEKYSRNPYENAKIMDSRNEQRNTVFYGNNENSYEYNNSMQRFHNDEDQFDDGPDGNQWP